MKALIGYLPAVVIIAVAVVILTVRLAEFVRTKGQSACDHCPYSGSCSSEKCKKHR